MARILFVAERFPPDVGGLATSGGRISRALAELGLEVDVIAWSRLLEAGKVQEQLTDLQGLRVFRVGQFRHWDMTMPATINIVEWLMTQRPYDFIWGHYLFPAGFLATWIGQLHNLKTIVSVRGNDLDREMFPPGDFSRLLWTLNHATTITAVSRDMAKKIEAVSARNDSIVLPNAVDTDRFAPAAVHGGLRDQLEIARDELVLGFSGELREKKGTPFLLQALTEIRKERPACLLIIGEVRAQQKATMQLYAAEHPDDAARVIVTGHLERVEQIVEHLQLCDIYLQPSLFEGMPNALLEAMACRCLCIASDAGGIPEIIDHGSNGFIVPRAHLDHLSTAIAEAISLDSALKESIEYNARQTIIESFCLENERQLLAKVVAPLLSIVR